MILEELEAASTEEWSKNTYQKKIKGNNQE